MKIGRVRDCPSADALAALEEHSNYPFRLLMKEFGASLVFSERVDAAWVARRDRRGLRRLYTLPGECPAPGNSAAADAGRAGGGRAVVEELGFDLVDLNFECPVRRLLARGEGGALLAEPAEIARLVAAVVRAVSLPVTLKIRSGPDAEHATAIEVARRAEQAGAAAVSIHARSVAQGYVGGPDWEVVAGVKRAVRIPVIGSGGIHTAAEAIDALRAQRGRRGGHRPRLPGQSLDLSPGPGAAGRRPGKPRPHIGRARAVRCCGWSRGSFIFTAVRWPCGGCRGPAAILPASCPVPRPLPTPCGRCKTCRGFALGPRAFPLIPDYSRPLESRRGLRDRNPTRKRGQLVGPPSLTLRVTIGA